MTGLWLDLPGGNDPAKVTQPSEQRDFPDWHRGRPRFAVWAIAVDQAEVDERLGETRKALQPLLLPGYERRPHITLHICGFPMGDSLYADDFTISHLQQQIAAIAALRLKPFGLRIGGAFSFASAACLAVDDDRGTLQGLRRACRRAAPTFDTTPYVPHVTAGLYKVAWPLVDIERRLRPWAAPQPIAVEVQALDWMVYDSGRIHHFWQW